MKPIVQRPFVNRNNKQLMVTIPKSKLPPRLRYAPNLLVELRVFKHRGSEMSG